MRKVRAWLPLAVASTILTLLIYAAVQQSLRQGANDPQIQLAGDAAARLSAGAKPTDLVPADTLVVDAAASLSPFVIIYDENGRVLAANGRLGSATLILPPGVLDATRKTGEDRITWQPATGVRLATVVRHVSGGQGGFVLAARNMREVESRIANVELMSGLALAAILAITLALALLA